MRTIALAALITLMAGCSTSRPSRADASAFSPSFQPPAGLETARVRLEPLGPKHAALDHAAFMSSRAHLHRTMHWGTWPREDMTVEENRKDLERHAREFDAREAYAYTVLRPDGSACVGCVYIDACETESSWAELAYWTTEAGVAAGLDEHLFAAVIDWIERDWPLAAVRVPIHVENERGGAIATARGLRSTGIEDDRQVFLWTRIR